MSYRAALICSKGLIVILLLSSIQVWASKVSTHSRCGAELSTQTVTKQTVPKQTSLLKVLGLSRQDVAILNRQTKESQRFPYGNPERILRRVIFKILRYSPAQQQEILQVLRGSGLFTETLVKSNLLLVLGDTDTWQTYLRSIVNDLTPTFYVFSDTSFWPYCVSQMPEEQRLNLLAKVGEVYSLARSESTGHSSPKRSLDFLIHAALQGGERIFADIEAGFTPFEAYDRLLGFQNEKLFESSPGVGNYGATSVLSALEIIQSHLHHVGVSEILIGGSFAAGRAKPLSSDIDYMSANRLNRTIENEMTLQIQKALHDAGLPNKLYLEVFPGRVGSPRSHSYPGSFASSAPVVFRITVKAIQMWVYPTRLHLEGKGFDSAMSSPVIYTL